jgi:hypothetical protein
MVESRLRERQHVTYCELLEYIQYERGLILQANTFRHVIWKLPTVKPIFAKPIEAERAEIDPETIRAWHKELTAMIQEISPISSWMFTRGTDTADREVRIINERELSTINQI